MFESEAEGFGGFKLKGCGIVSLDEVGYSGWGHITCFARRWCSHLSTGEKKLASNVQATVSLGPVHNRRINPRYINDLRSRWKVPNPLMKAKP